MATIYGTTSSDTKNGTSDQDTIYGWAKGGDANSPSGNDTLKGLAGDDKLFGGTGKDSLKGVAGNDTLDGGLGTDTLNGGTGNDTYIIDGTPSETYDADLIINDEITEPANSGTDTVVLTIQGFAGSYINYYSLENNLENLTLKGQEYDYGIIIQGNAKDNVIFGGDLINEYDPGLKSSEPYLYGLQGGGGNDKLYGEAGDDGLAGDSGNDTLIGGDSYDELYGGVGFDSLIGGTDDDSLDGGAGTDTLIGGTGNDIYFIDSAIDTITEYFNQGSDGVVSALNYILGENSNLENLELDDSAESGTGNSLDNKIYGNSNNNYLYGAQGNDLLDDFNSIVDDTSYLYEIYGELDLFEPSNDYFDGGAGNDTLEAGEGNDSLYGRNGNDKLNGEGGNDAVYGGDGNDNLNGFYGADTLAGGLGLDTFYFEEPSQEIDTIKDFVVAEDTIEVSDSYYDYGFGGGLTPGATITDDQFVIGSAVADASDRFIYNQKTGALFFDADGTGATEQVQFAQLSTGLDMTNADIFVEDAFSF